MPLPIPNLDDRRFDDLVTEAVTRVEAYTPEWSNVAPGDPGLALIDLFAWLTETILYRQNLIPLRQRRAFLNLLAQPLRPPAPASGVVCVDATQLPLPAAIPAGQAQFHVGAVTFTSTTDLQPAPLQLVPLIKARYQDPDTVAQARLISLLRTLYSYDQPVPFVAQPAFGADGTMGLGAAIDGQVWLALVTPKGFASSAASVGTALAGSTDLSGTGARRGCSRHRRLRPGDGFTSAHAELGGGNERYNRSAALGTAGCAGRYLERRAHPRRRPSTAAEQRRTADAAHAAERRRSDVRRHRRDAARVAR